MVIINYDVLDDQKLRYLFIENDHQKCMGERKKKEKKKVQSNKRIMDQVFGKVGSYWLNQKANNELSNDVNVT